ncbi:MAG: putative porin [Bacteroidales bacterium]|nr:putative porin [Bacteroidales bacterium]
MRIYQHINRLLFAVGLLVVLFSGGLQAQEEAALGSERTIDSAMAISPAFMPVYTAALPTIFFHPMNYTPVDTSIFHTAEYDPLWQNKNIYQSLGIDGQAHKNMIFDYAHDLGFSMITLPYELYFKQQKDLKYYNVQTSFTNLAYTFGISGENSFQATHAQRIRQCEFVVDLDGYSNKGYFIHQGANKFNLDFIFHYETPNKIYGITASYILNHGKFSENGGLADYHSFADRNVREENATNNLSSFNVLFSNASTLINTHDAQMMQYVNFKDKKGHYFGTLTHTFQFKYLKSTFYDQDLNNAFYHDRYYINTDTTNDTLQYYKIINSLQWSNFEPLDTQSSKNYFIRLAGGIRHEYVNAHMPFYIGNSFTLFARTSIRLFKVWDIYGSIDYSFLSYNKNDATAHAIATFALNRKHKHYIGLQADFYRVSPDYFYSYYVGNNSLWYNDLQKENNLKLSAYWTLFDYKVSFNYFMLNHHVFINQNFTPQVAEKSINIIQLNAFAPLRIHNFYMDVNMSLQHSTQPYVRVPLFAGKLYAAYCFRIFKNRLRVQIGGDLMYNTLYFADAYNPLLHQFYYQERTKVGNYLYFNANITLQVERIAFYFRAGNIIAGLFSYKYFTTPYYPMQGQNFELGITWRFYD